MNEDFFKDIRGNERVKKFLKNSIRAGTVGHAYIFAGADGIGKKTVSAAFAAAILKQTAQGNPDVIFVKPEGKNFKAEEVREKIVNEAIIRPYAAERKIFIIENAGTLNVASQNILLKTLEEPPDYAVFILLSKDVNFLPTVLSRSVVIKLQPLTAQEVRRTLLAEEEITAEKAAFCAVFANGALGKARQAAKDENFAEIIKTVTNIVENIMEADAADVLLEAHTLEKFKDRIDDILDILIIGFRDVAVFAQTGDENLMFNPAYQKKATNVGDAVRAVNAVFETKKYLKQNTNFLLTMEIMLLRIRGLL